MQGVKDRSKGLLARQLPDGGMDQDIQDETSLMDSHILDSTGFIELISYLEEQFQIEVSDDEMVPDNLDSEEHRALRIHQARPGYLGLKRVRMESRQAARPAALRCAASMQRQRSSALLKACEESSD